MTERTTDGEKRTTEKRPSGVVRESSAWSAGQISDFLQGSRLPLRLSVNSGSGFPLLCSLWFVEREGALLCVTHRRSKVARALAVDSRCAFEVSPNEAPYRGVRGQGRTTLNPEGAAELLECLLERYVGSQEGRLGRWLLSRAEDERIIRIDPIWVTAWDYSERMSEP